MDLHKFAEIAVGSFGGFATIFLFVLGREFFRLDKWKEELAKYIAHELDRQESFIREYKKDYALTAESIKTSVSKEFERLRKEDAEYRKYCVFNITTDIKRINGDSKKDAKEIGTLMGEHRKLEYMVDTIRQFYEENRSLLEDKVHILKLIEGCEDKIDNRFKEIESKLLELDILKNNMPPVEVE